MLQPSSYSLEIVLLNSVHIRVLVLKKVGSELSDLTGFIGLSFDGSPAAADVFVLVLPVYKVC